MRRAIVAIIAGGLMTLSVPAFANNGKPSSNACKGLTNAASHSNGHRSDNGQAQLDQLQAIACADQSG